MQPTRKPPVRETLDLLRPHVRNSNVIVNGWTSYGLIFAGQLYEIFVEHIVVLSSDRELTIPIAQIHELKYDFLQTEEQPVRT